MKKKLCRLSLIATGILATGGAITSLTACNKNTVDETVGQVEYLDLSSSVTIAIGLKNAGSKIKSITVPNQYNGKEVAYIAKAAFADCPNLESISLPFIGKTANATGTDAMFGYIFGSDMYEGCGGFTWQEAESSVTNETIYAQYAIPQNLAHVTITNASNIPAGAFSNCKYLESITINNADIKTIENKAFYCCSSLEKFDLSFSNSLETIEESAFEKCYTLSSITIPNTVKTIEENAFASCLSATKATIPASVKEMQAGAFANLGGIILVEATEEETTGWDSNWTDSDVAVVYDFKSDSSYAYIEDWLVIICGSGNNKYGYLAQWMGNWQQSVITIPGKVTIDGTELPVKIVGGKCFNENYYIQRLIIEEGVTTIHPNVFEGCTSLQYVDIPSTLTDIRDQAFKNCSALVGRYVDGLPTKGIDFANVTHIRKQAFYGCSSITDIELEHVQEIGDEAFAYCTHLCQENHTEVDPDTGLSYILSIPETCTTLGEGAFKWCFKYAPSTWTASYFYPTVWFAHGSTSKLTAIPESSFESCGVRVKTPTSGEDKGTVYPNYIRVSIHLGDAPLTRIENAAFKNCYMYHLKGARQTHLEYIGDYAFYYAQMTSEESESSGGKQDLQMDQEIKYIGEYAFAYCTTICSLTFNTQIDDANPVEKGFNSLEHLGQFAFYGCNNVNFTTLDLSVCQNLKTEATTKTGTTYDSTKTPRYAFAACTHLQNVKLPGSDVSIPNTEFKCLPERMFESCTDLGRDGSEIIIPSQVIEIRTAAFNGCNYLTKCYIDGTINFYGSSIFYNNYALETVTKSDGTTVAFDDNILTGNIGSSIYYKCEKLTNAPIPVGTARNYTLNGSMFYGNKALTSITIPAKIYNIGGSCFSGCTSLTSVTFDTGSELTTLSANCFEGCTSLTSLDLSSTKLYGMYDKAFSGMGGSSGITIKLPNKQTKFYSKPLDGLTSIDTISFGRKSVKGYTGAKTWDNPDEFYWNENSSIKFTKQGTSGNYYYLCENDAFGGTNVKFVCYTPEGE